MKKKEAYVFWNADMCYVVEYPSQKRVCRSKHFRGATRKARNLGYDVKVYKGDCVIAPRDAVDVTYGAYVLPRVRSKA